MHGNMLCYVASGLGFSKFFRKESLKDKEILNLIGRWIKKLDNTNNHRFSILFNAYTEKKIAPLIQETIKPYVYDVYSDSGGLQIISRGFTITPDLKKEIYQIQGKYSDVAMSFDEIPVYTLVNKSELKDASNKVFDRSRLISCAKETAKNITEQISLFIDNKSKTKPLAIIQGNDLETAMIWADTLFKNIPKDMHDAIGGIAIGSPALGVGELEEVKKAFWFTRIRSEIIDLKHFHLLGVGAMKRFVPTLVFIKSGLFKDTFVSYDSTTHTSMNIYGRYYYGKKPNKQYQIVYNRKYNQVYDEIYDDIISFLPELSRWCKDSKEFHYVMNINPNEYFKRHGTKMPIIMSTIAHSISCINNFTKHVDDALKDDEVLYEMIDEVRMDKKTKIKYVDKTKRNVYNELKKVKTLDDYIYWENHLGRFLNSKPSRSSHSTLDGFFE